MRTITLNEDDMGCEHGPEFRVTCGTCERNWCDKCTPTHGPRCPYEYEHDEEPEPKTFDELVEEFWLYAEPVYAKFDEQTKARITVALDVFRRN